MNIASIRNTIMGICLLAVGLTAGADPFEYTWTELAPGVWTGIREDSPRIPVMGTTTFVVGDEGVVVFDGGGIPLMSERAIAKVRSVTDKPVTHVAVSHWHQDHNFGIRAFREVWPGVQVVSHHFTRKALIRSNEDESGELKASIRDMVTTNAPAIEKLLENDAFSDGRPLSEHDRARFRQFLDDAEFLDREYRRIDPLYPDVTFDREFVIHQGSREVHLLHLGRGNTAGDIVLWLPAERIVAAGDLVVRPTPYGFGSYPREWAGTLEKVKALDYRVLVPGHGDIQRDTAYVDLLIETLTLVADQMEALVAQGLKEEEAVERLDFSAVEERFTGGDAFLAGRFLSWFKRPIGQAAWRVANGQSPSPDTE